MKQEQDLNKSEFARFLSDQSLFEGISPKQYERLLKNGYRIIAEKGEFIFREGDPADCLFVIKSGRVKLTSYDVEGRERIIAIFGNGETIWESVFLEERSFPFSAVALGKVDCCKLYSVDFEQAISEGESAMRSIKLLSKKLHDANQRNMILSSSDPKIKIARLFLYRQEIDAGRVLTMRLDDIAATLSIRPETASRKLRELIDDGIIYKSGQSNFIIKNYDELKKIAEN
ncbi:MAG: Crp/Fnr family transcriptional regulator [Bacillota bacterium]|nr:Crp/Fnr family transcriptional regulator [Bacillota bacterium]